MLRPIMVQIFTGHREVHLKVSQEPDFLRFDIETLSWVRAFDCKGSGRAAGRHHLRIQQEERRYDLYGVPAFIRQACMGSTSRLCDKFF